MQAEQIPLFYMPQRQKEFHMNEIEMKFMEQCSQFSYPIDVTARQMQQLRTFYENLVEWNKVMNLTAITEEGDVYIKHFLDSLSLAEVVSLSKEGSSRKKIIDVGTGAGFPGLVLAVIMPKCEITLMDSLNKRIRFLQDTIQKAGIQNVTLIHARAEDLARDKKQREQYDWAVSRAVANLATLSEYCLPFVKKSGVFIAYKAEKAEEEVTTAGKAMEVLGGELEQDCAFQLPGTDYQRHLIVIRKKRSTPGTYPRKAGMPAKEPIH